MYIVFRTMKWTFIVINILLNYSFAHSAAMCPDDPINFENEHKAVAGFKALDQLVIDSRPTDNCLPKTVYFYAIGRPLCLFKSQIPVLMASSITLADGGDSVTYMYIVEYSSDVHKKLQEILSKRYQPVPSENYPERLKSMPVHQELTSLFKERDVYISLQKPSDGMPGEWHSVIMFEKEKYIDFSRRDLNSCR